MRLRESGTSEAVAARRRLAQTHWSTTRESQSRVGRTGRGETGVHVPRRAPVGPRAGIRKPSDSLSSLRPRRRRHATAASSDFFYGRSLARPKPKRAGTPTGAARGGARPRGGVRPRSPKVRPVPGVRRLGDVRTANRAAARAEARELPFAANVLALGPRRRGLLARVKGKFAPVRRSTRRNYTQYGRSNRYGERLNETRDVCN